VPRVPPKFVPAADLVDLGDSRGDGEVIGESVLIDRHPHSTECDWLRVETWIDHGRRFEDLHRGRVNLDRGAAEGHVLVDQEPRLGGAPRGPYAADEFGPNPALGCQAPA
jgi:hypothetical protein